MASMVNFTDVRKWKLMLIFRQSKGLVSPGGGAEQDGVEKRAMVAL